MKVILDTSGWYAHAIKDDKFHDRTEEFLSEERQLVVLGTVFEELVAILQNRHGKDMAKNNGAILRKLGLVRLTESEETKAWKLFEESEAKVSYVDCTVAVVAKSLGVPVFGFDSDFGKLGVEVVPV